MNARQAFEGWIKQERPSWPIERSANPDDWPPEYIDKRVQYSWEAFEAAESIYRKVEPK